MDVLLKKTGSDILDGNNITEDILALKITSLLAESSVLKDAISKTLQTDASKATAAPGAEMPANEKSSINLIKQPEAH